MIWIDENDLRGQVDEMVARAEAGEIVVITRDGAAVARLEPMLVGGGEVAS